MCAGTGCPLDPDGAPDLDRLREIAGTDSGIDVVNPTADGGLGVAITSSPARPVAYQLLDHATGRVAPRSSHAGA